jgi:hypothetical protein
MKHSKPLSANITTMKISTNHLLERERNIITKINIYNSSFGQEKKMEMLGSLGIPFW